MDDRDLRNELAVEVVYVDEHMIELETTVGVGCWRGRARAYTVSDDVATFAAAAQRFADGGPPVAFEAGTGNGTGLLGLRFYRVDRSGHIAGHVRLESDAPTGYRPEQVARLAVEFGAEAWAVTLFAEQVAELARAKAGRATLAITPGI